MALLSPYPTAAELAELRAIAESGHVDECVITRQGAPDPDADIDPVTLQYPAVQELTIYTGACKAQRPEQEQSATDSAAAAGDWAQQRLRVDIPVLAQGSDQVRRGDVVRITRATHDPALEGRVATVTGLHHKSFATARRLNCTEGV